MPTLGTAGRTQCRHADVEHKPVGHGNRQTPPLRQTGMRLRVAALAASLALTGCGEPSADSAAPTRPADGATSTVLPSPTAVPSWGSDESAKLVTPAPGTIKPRAIAWQRAKPGADGRSVRIFFTSGVEPCNVLDHVKVNYLAERIMVTLYEGSGPGALTQGCVALAVFKAVDVRLDQPIGKRTFGDGAPG
jgi:hypothetical protein